MKTLITILVLLVSISNEVKPAEMDEKIKLIYVYDPLCGWCYGFSPVIMEAYNQYHQKIDFEIVSGGMRVGDNVGPIGEVAPYIAEAYKRVENVTGVKFGEKFLKNIMAEGTAVFTSMPASVTMTVFREKHPEKAFEFAKLMQKAIYYDGIEPAKEAPFVQLANEMGYPKKAFKKAMQDERYIEKTYLDFQRAATLGARGFPSVFIEQDGEYHRIVSGYIHYEELEKRIAAFLR